MLSISLNIILDKISSHQHSVHIKMPCAKAFSRTALLPRNSKDMTSDWLYVCRLSDYIRVAPHTPDIYYLCLRDRMEDSEETEDLLSNTIIINENIELEYLFTEIQDIFFRINEWIQEMQEKVIHSDSLQSILDLSEPIIGNTINISDSALTLLAHTWNIEPDDTITLALIENGFHPESSLQKFREGKRFAVWDNSSGIIVNEHPNYCSYPTVGKVFKFHNTYFAHIVMVCDHRPLTPGLLDLFRILLDILQSFVKREWDSKSSVDHVYDSLLTDLLSGNLGSKTNLEERARHAGIPLTGPYQVLRIACSQEMQAPVGRMAQELGDMMPDSWTLIYQQQLVVLDRVKKNRSAEDTEAFDRRMRSFLERYDAFCAASPEFANLKSMADAYEKASLALKYSGRFYGDDLLDRYEYSAENNRIYQYDDNLIFYLLGENERSQSIWKDSTYAQALRTLWEYDNQHNTDNLQLLYTYLRCERKATDASQLLHMHRNNVVYRINRIEELLGMSLDDDNVRLCLSLSYVMLRLTGLEE